jgi:phage shock protein A
MKSQKQIESAIEEVKRRIADAQDLQAIAMFAGSEKLLALLNKTRQFYEKNITSLDESNPALSREYAKQKACLSLLDGFINGITKAEDQIELLKKTFLALNEELGKVIDEQKRREAKSM